MEATVTMSLKQYDDLKDEIADLVEQVELYQDRESSILQVNKEQGKAIKELFDYVMEMAFYEHELGRKSLDELLENWHGEKRLKCMSSTSDFDKFGITLDMQRDYVTRRYNEYQAELEAQKQQEELENGSK